jgi:hypothetical protein
MITVNGRFASAKKGKIGINSRPAQTEYSAGWPKKHHPFYKPGKKHGLLKSQSVMSLPVIGKHCEIGKVDEIVTVSV